MNNDLKTRRDTYYQLNSHLAHVDAGQLKTLFDDDEKKQGWGSNHTIKLGKFKSFVKRIPVTEVEYAHLYSTKNLFELPTYYNYGVGSAGFGAFRELVTHVKTTNWVLAGVIENFPLMYHYRVVPRLTEPAVIDRERHQRYVTYWNGNKSIAEYMLARSKAAYEVVLFLEYIPHTLWTWLPNNMDQLDQVIMEMRETITFLHKNDIIHFDAHYGNIVTDGRKLYLTDFGLVLDRRFDLSESERLFFKKNRYYDYGEFLVSLGWFLLAYYDDLSTVKKRKIRQSYNIEEEMSSGQRLNGLLQNIEALANDNIMNLNKNYVDKMIQYRDIIRLMSAFFTDMRQNNKKDTSYNQTKLKRLLHMSEFLPE